jgi:hypothetical protein
VDALKAASSSNIVEFIQKARKIHGDMYDYSKSVYININTKIIIICPKHGEFLKRPDAHLSGQGCPSCRISKGEIRVKEFLEKNNIIFVPQFTFHNCKNVKPLPFDFYIPLFNLCIEYDGEQHHVAKTHFGGIEGLNKRQLHDNIKTEFCKLNKIELIRIPHMAYNDIENMLINTVNSRLITK